MFSVDLFCSRIVAVGLTRSITTVMRNIRDMAQDLPLFDSGIPKEIRKEILGNIFLYLPKA